MINKGARGPVYVLGDELVFGEFEVVGFVASYSRPDLYLKIKQRYTSST